MIPGWPSTRCRRHHWPCYGRAVRQIGSRLQSAIHGPATELQARVAGIDVNGTVATVRLELDNWNGYRFTDLFTLLKVDGEWKIMNNVFHLHA